MRIINILFLFLIFSGRYHRKHWRHWIDVDGDCQNTRQEILLQRSLAPTSLNKKGCVVLKGKWADYYFNETLFDSREIDVDHLVPLKHAHDHGGEDWDREKKKQFANDPDNLVLTHKKYNRMKGSKGIDQWLPIDPDYACKYVRDWINVKNKYLLKITDQEMNTVNLLKNKCQS